MFDMDIPNIMMLVAVAAVPVIFAITVHEVAHGWVALHLGDPTAKLAGRLTLNPIVHIDLLGTVIVPFAMLVLGSVGLTGGIIFGWAKPVPVVFQNLRNPRRDMVLVAAAGPGVNLAMAMGWSLLLSLRLSMAPEVDVSADWIGSMCFIGITINVILAVFNMLPIPPLDGGRVLAGLVPPPMARVVDRVEPYGFLIVVVLLVSGVLGSLLNPVLLPLVRFFMRSVAGLA